VIPETLRECQCVPMLDVFVVAPWVASPLPRRPTLTGGSWTDMRRTAFRVPWSLAALPITRRLLARRCRACTQSSQVVVATSPPSAAADAESLEFLADEAAQKIKKSAPRAFREALWRSFREEVANFSPKVHQENSGKAPQAVDFS